MSETLSEIVRLNDRTKPTASLHVEVIADLVCPFSFVGKRRFDAALHAVQGPSEVTWYPYQLNPDIPAEGLPFDVYLSQRFSTPANVDPVLEFLKVEGESVGIEFRFDLIQHVPNSLPVHQIMQLAETRGKDPTALAEDLFSAFFEQGRNIGEREVLVDIAAAYGIGEAEANRAVDSDKLKQLVLTREAQVRSSGIAGIPGFLINRRLLVVGAQETDNIVNAFDRAMFGEGDDELGLPVLH
ncbi:MAG: DsbA family oxidoreductase [Gammaproteobacteria bacterium]|nr:DsbA family oxidoreductase [Gammaproteobacteria bacterium]